METGFAPVASGRAQGPRGRFPAREVDASRPRSRRLGRGKRRHILVERLLARLSGPLPSLLLALGLFLGTFIYGAVLGGHYQSFVATHGEPADLIAKALGFGISTVTITGGGDLDETAILAAGEIGPRNSLLLLDAASVRQKLKTIPAIKEASVAKLYPDRLLIEIEERRPAALWQVNGRVAIVAADGTVLGPYDDARFMNLPHVVGAGANAKVGEYLALLEAAGDLRDRIRAGVLVSLRRWILKTTNGVDIHLPETNFEAAVASLVQLQRASRVLDKDVLALDFREPGRVAARLGADAAAAHAEAIVQKTKSKGGHT